jgi:HEAT repeat protein
MVKDRTLEELFDLFVRDEIPGEVRAAIANQFGENHYLLAKEAVLAGLCDRESLVRDACIDVLANQWHLQEVGPKLVEMMEHDEQDFVRMRAAQGLGALRQLEAVPFLKRIILNSNGEEALQETAYEALLAILGKGDEVLERGIDEPTVIDWELVRSL